ncbi:MAG: GNAT family N-acetyltransferase [Mycobacteriales bacterium]
MLRPHQRGDFLAWREVRLANQQWLSPWEATATTPWEWRHERGDYRAMLRGQREAISFGQAMPFVICYRGALTGQLTVGSIVRGAFYSANIGYWIDGRLAGRGIMPHALAMACDFCFFAAGLHRIEINIRPENIASRRVVEKLGFRYEGFHPRFLHIDGDWRDHMGFALTVEDVLPGGALARWRVHRQP